MSEDPSPAGASSSNGARTAPPGSGADPLALSPGSVLAEFRVSRVLGSGGFGIVYLAHDDSLHRDVAIKEYLPASLAGRTPEGQVIARSADSEAAFSMGLKSFVNEARLLARFDHASLVKVHRFWEDRGTAYMAMPYYKGATLRQVRKSLDEPPDEAWLKRLLDGLLGAIDALHRANILHRDVAPDNILMLHGGAPLLLDFGAARHVLAEQPQVLTAMLKPTYAPIEQYAFSAGAGDLRQGPWTDLYATAATLHYCLTGEAPPAAAARTLDDRYRPLHRRADLRQRDGLPYDGRWLAAIDWALEVLPSRRPQSVAQWRAALEGRRSAPQRISGDVPIGRESIDATDDFPTTEVHARHWVPTLSEAALAAAAELGKDTAAMAGTSARMARSTPRGFSRDTSRDTSLGISRGTARSPQSAGNDADAGPLAALRGALSRTGWRAGWRGPVLLAGVFGLLGILGFAQFGALPRQELASAGQPSVSAAASPAVVASADTVNGMQSGDLSGAPFQAALPPASAAAAVLREFAAVSSHGSQEIHETAADQGRVITVPPRSFGAQEAGSGTGVTRTSADGNSAKQAPRRRTVARAQVLQTPREFCEADDRGWFSRMICMHKSCDLPKWREHPQCANWRRPTTAQRTGSSGPS